MIILGALVGLSFQLLPNSSPHRPPPRDSLAPARVRIAAASAQPRIDGALDDDVWRSAAPTSGFVQAEPDEGKPATEATDVRVAYDDATLYIAAYMHDSNPREIVVNDDGAGRVAGALGAVP